MNNKPVNKITNNFIKIKIKFAGNKNKDKFKINSKINNPAISIIVCTMRENSLDNVFKNFNRQIHKNKEMIIILNNNKIDKNMWDEQAKSYKNINVFQLDENITLGSCLNFGVSKARANIIAKFDDDDYYGPKYLSDSIKSLKYGDIIGKAASFVFLKKRKILAIRSPKSENKYVKHMDGPTLIIKKHVFDSVKFADIPKGVDTRFSKDCTEKGFKIYSTNRFHHVYIRSESSDSHTWKISDNDLLKMCRKVKQNIEDFTPYVDI